MGWAICMCLLGSPASIYLAESLTQASFTVVDSMRESIHAIRCDFLSPQGTQE